PIDAEAGLTAVACASNALCVVADAHGNVMTSTNPTGDAGAWSPPAHIAALPNEDPEPINALSCPTTTFCAATDGYDYLDSEGFSRGDVMTSTTPRSEEHTS